MTTKSKTVEVTLAKAHTHKGERKAKGAKLTVSPAVAQWMYSNGVAVKPAATQETK
jgi:hypothetical protein